MIRLVGEKLKRYDLDRTVEIAPRHNNEIYEVRFVSEGFEDVKVTPKESDGKYVADIPNVLLRSGGVITCRVISIDEKDNVDTEAKSFVIHNRKKPDDYEYSENVQTSGGGSAGGGAFVVNWLLDDSGENYADKTFEEILEASKTMPVILVYTNSYDGSTQTYTLNNCAEDGFHAFFTRIMPSGISNGVYTGMRADYAQIAKGSNAITYGSVNL